MTSILVLHPGRMGAALGRTLVTAGHDVGWLPRGRGPGTARRAEAAGLVARDGVQGCDVVLSVCPPAAAVETARSVAGFRGLYVDANAISPDTARRVAAVIEDAGATYVDASVIGSPPGPSTGPRLPLSGARAGDVAALFDGTPVQPVVLTADGATGDTAASALKMSYAAWTKITAALLVGIRGTARSMGVADALAEEWRDSHPGLLERATKAERSAQERGWRWAEEMRQIAATFAAVDQPSGFGEAAAELFGRVPRPPDE